MVVLTKVREECESGDPDGRVWRPRVRECVFGAFIGVADRRERSAQGSRADGMQRGSEDDLATTAEGQCNLAVSRAVNAAESLPMIESEITNLSHQNNIRFTRPHTNTHTQTHINTHTPTHTDTHKHSNTQVSEDKAGPLLMLADK